MASLTTRTSRVGDVTLVELLVSAETPARVRLENCLDGPVWPPRRQGVPESGWDETGFEGVVRDRLTLGYATPAEPADQPARLVSSTQVDDGTDTTAADDPTPADIVRSLGDARPPRDAVGAADGSESTTAEQPTTTVPDDRTPPQELTDWLDAIEERLDTAERLAAATSVQEATEAVAAVGGAADVTALDEQLAVDQEALARVCTRCDALAERSARVEIPVETLSRLA